MNYLKLFFCFVGLMIGSLPIAQAGADLSDFRTAAPRSILVVPVINETLNVDLQYYFLTTLTEPLAEKGFYVFPVNTVKYVLEQEGFYEAEKIHEQPPQALAKLFGADSVLFVKIKRGDITGFLRGSATIELQYRMMYKNGTEIWRADAQRKIDGVSHVSANLAAATVSKDTISALLKVNIFMINRELFALEQTGFPNGPYRDKQ